MTHKPDLLDKDQLVKLVRHIADLIDIGDSFEGNLEYLIPDSSEDIEAGKFAVRASFRFGNSEGQGGMRFVGDIS